MIRRAGLFGGTLGVALVASSSWPIVQGALAKDHGVMGQTWAIAEPDLLATIDTRLKTLQANGGIERMQTALREKTEERVRNPIPVAGIGAVRESRSWTFDPTIVLDQDIQDQKGRQVDWALKRWTAQNAKIIFVAGSPFNRMGEKKRRFFFDQQGKLTSHFGIARVPAVVEPAGQLLRISEIEMPGAGA